MIYGRHRVRLAKRNGLRKAKVAVARKLAVILHRNMDRWNRVQLVEEGDCCLARALPSSCQTAGKDVPAGTMAMVSSTDFLRASERATAIATLNRQRHLTPSCGGSTPTAERAVGPARTIVGELDTQTRN